MLRERKRSYMVDKLIEDINKSLDNNAYLAALSLALTLPDICGKAAYPCEKSTKRRYVDWYDDNIGQYEHPPYKDGEQWLPYLSGELVYQLRCSMLHQGTPTIDHEQICDEVCKIDKFALIIQGKNDLEIYGDSACLSKSCFGNQVTKVERTYHVNVRRLCFVICACAKGYFHENRNKFDFFNYTIIDYDKEVNRHEY